MTKKNGVKLNILTNIEPFQHTTVTGKLRYSIGRLTQSTNRQSELSSLSNESRAKKAQCNRTLKNIYSNFELSESSECSGTIQKNMFRI